MSEYVIRRMRPEDAPGVAELARRVWGDKYAHTEVYHPDELVRMDAEGRNISVVAVDENGRVAAHDALERYDLGPVGETGQAMVAPEHRGKGLMSRTRRFVLQIAAEMKLMGVFGEPVTYHVVSQKVYEELGFRPVGISLGFLPEGLEPDSVAASSQKGRTSVVLYFHPLQPPRPRTVFPPERHGEIIRRLYALLGFPVEFSTEKPLSSPGGNAPFAIEAEDMWSLQAALIRCASPSVETPGDLKRAVDKCAGRDVLFLEALMESPHAPAVCAAAEEMGFFFSGIGPCFAQGRDVIRYCRLNVPVDTAQMQIINPTARDLLAYVESERKRIMSHRP